MHIWLLVLSLYYVPLFFFAAEKSLCKQASLTRLFLSTSRSREGVDIVVAYILKEIVVVGRIIQGNYSVYHKAAGFGSWLSYAHALHK